MPTPSPSQLGAAIRQQRKARDRSIESVAAAIGIHWTYLSKIERGLGNPSWTVVAALADELKIEIEDLTRLARELPA